MAPVYVGKTGADFEAAPEGLHYAVCIDIHDRGMLQTNFGQQHKIDIWWALDPALTDSAGNYFRVFRRYTASLNEKANLYKDLVTWRGKKFSAAELEQFDLEKLLSANCQLQIVHNLGGDSKVYANVQAIVPAGKGATKLRIPDGYVRWQDRDKQPAGSGAVPGGVPDDDDIPFICSGDVDIHRHFRI